MNEEMREAAYMHRYLIGSAADLLGLCMMTMRCDPDKAMCTALGKHCGYLAGMIRDCATRLADIAQPSSEEVKAAMGELSMVPETEREGIAFALCAAKAAGFQPGQVLEQVASLTGEKDPFQMTAKLLSFGKQVESTAAALGESQGQLLAVAPILSAARQVTGKAEGSGEEVAGALLALSKDAETLRADQPVVLKAKEVTGKATAEEITARLGELALLPAEIERRDYDAELSAGIAQNKIVGESEIAWVRANVKTVSGLKDYVAGRTPSHLGTTHQDPTHAQVVEAHKTATAAAQEAQLLSSVTLSADEEAILAATASERGMTPEVAAQRRTNYIQAKAQRAAKGG